MLQAIGGEEFKLKLEDLKAQNKIHGLEGQRPGLKKAAILENLDLKYTLTDLYKKQPDMIPMIFDEALDGFKNIFLGILAEVQPSQGKVIDKLKETIEAVGTAKIPVVNMNTKSIK